MKKSEMEKIIERIKDRRLSLGLSYQDLADKTGMSKSTLQRYETGFIKNLGIDKLEMLAQALETTPGYLMGWDKPTPAKLLDLADATEMEYRDLMKLAGYVEEVHDKDKFFELVFKDSKGKVVDVRRGVKEMFSTDEDWANVAYRVSKELTENDREILKSMAEKFLELKKKR
ncbi:helix-turn-helix transcriptional regulator [Desulfosporosinus sp. Sb-LF]|uniref:helix-turn-helix domain-containing protein n=1 Tax=Desulfosporosinus sp. Sb-LF TaxID=2560027 RepID=UPI00107F429D|nr:helix-turn-helix transcriptional regulator [Desulfosporosinus sp. Sb-LF]TGE33355.1 XRE family transcriptional regulator [Desulfosporosinus sp. Sb-LF]